MRRALSQIGTPYRYAQESPRSGVDCSGLTYWTFKNHGATLARSSSQQWRLRSQGRYKQILKIRNLRRGDLVFFKTGGAPVGHVGMYIGRHRFVHSSSSRGGVRRDSLDSYYRRTYVGAVRVPALRTDLANNEWPAEQGSDDGS